MLPFVSFCSNARKLKEAIEWRRHYPSDRTSLLYITRYAVHMLGLGILLVPVRLLATHWNQRPKPTAALSQDLTSSKVHEWSAVFHASSAYTDTKEALESHTIPCSSPQEVPEELSIHEELEESESASLPVTEPLKDTTAPCLVKVRVVIKSEVDISEEVISQILKEETSDQKPNKLRQFFNKTFWKKNVGKN